VHPATAIDFWWMDLLTHSDGLEIERKNGDNGILSAFVDIYS